MISIVVPVYNVEKYIVKCLDSIMNQDYQNFEIVLVNDGSTDNSVKIINDYFENKDVIWKLINKENGGLASARNVGIARSKGEYIAFVDSDDTISPDFLSSLLNEIKDNELDFAFCNFEFTKNQEIPNDDNDTKTIYTKEELLVTFLKRSINFVVPSMMFKREFLLGNYLMFNESLRFSEDQPFIWNVILHCNKAVYLYKKMYGYYIRENSIMTSTSYTKLVNSYKEYSKYIKDLFLMYPQYKNIEKLIIPRWELGSLFTASKLLDYSQFKQLYNMMDGTTIYKRVKDIDEEKAKLLGLLCSFSSLLMYKICKKMNLNG